MELRHTTGEIELLIGYRHLFQVRFRVTPFRQAVCLRSFAMVPTGDHFQVARDGFPALLRSMEMACNGGLCRWEIWEPTRRGEIWILTVWGWRMMAGRKKQTRWRIPFIIIHHPIISHLSGSTSGFKLWDDQHQTRWRIPWVQQTSICRAIADWSQLRQAFALWWCQFLGAGTVSCVSIEAEIIFEETTFDIPMVCYLYIYILYIHILIIDIIYIIIYIYYRLYIERHLIHPKISMILGI